MTVCLRGINETDRGPIHLVIAGYRAQPAPGVIQAANLSGATYAVHWAAGKWAEAGASVGVMARSVQVGVPALKAGRLLAGVGSLAGGAGGMLVLGAGQFRHRYWCARRDGKRLAGLLGTIPGIRTRPLHLIGHSLGTVVIRSALETLAEDYRIENVMLMGGVAGRDGWESVAQRFTGRLVNLYSRRDAILSIAPVMERLVGNGVVATQCPSLSTTRLINHDLCSQLPNPLNAIAHHSGYWKHFGRYL
ncbi:Protein of unknown function [Neorhodopirellula lusitana]|uniref:Uncharacterized protein n=1 Tax=Neorhodopirellula lusitana TaxID=445327 RepID=A0ABY1QK61_9BACT|nr:DUF726 domain-containing protein [Neorhodopirellula lusitana]SMP70234.1 Protein of unknown function [Neorhodopirellula lusitana]